MQHSYRNFKKACVSYQQPCCSKYILYNDTKYPQHWLFSLCSPAGQSHWNEDSVVSSSDGGSASDSLERFQADLYHCSPQEPSKIKTLIRVTQQLIKEEDSRLQLHKVNQNDPIGLANGLPKDSSPCFTPDYTKRSLPLQAVICRGLGQVGRPTLLSRNSSPGSECHHKPKDHLCTDLSLFSLPLHPPFGRTGTCSTSPSLTPALYPSHTYPRSYLDKHTAYSLTGYTLEHLYDAEGLRGYCTSASTGPAQCNVTPHLSLPAEQTPGH